MAARLAVANPRVIAVACGGFPLTADLSGMGQRARRRNADARQDPTTEAELLAAYDPAAAVAFWDDVALLPRAALADLDCPMRAWWGGQDAVLSSMLGSEALATDLECRRIEYQVVPGLDHDGMLDRLDLVLPAIATWLADMFQRPR
jgi:pimeloyl-ACP methyl ester carboxylesterase